MTSVSHIVRYTQWLLLFVALFLCSCNKRPDNPYSHLTLENYASLRLAAYNVDAGEIRDNISRLICNDRDTVLGDARLRRYYRDGGDFVWLTRFGIDGRADTLMSFVRSVVDDGFSLVKYHVDDIETDLSLLRSMNVDSICNINVLMARLEYNLSKAYLHYASVCRYGYVNPYTAFNRMDAIDDTPVNGYHTLYDVPTDVAHSDFLAMIFRHATMDSIGNYLRSVQPVNPLYYVFRRRLKDTSCPLSQRMKLMVNMERCRWRVSDYPHNNTTFVLVNIPSYMLRAVTPDTVVEMKIVCGALKTKTPIITSKLKRIDINPQWVIPRSIVRKDVAHHAGNAGYFTSRHYFIRHRASGKKVPVNEVSSEMLLSGEYAVVQEGGAGNALGRIIFRFDNNLSIYLHDTSSPSVFLRDDRRASHGCVRVEKPYLLASLLMGRDNDTLLQKISYSINADVSPLGKKRSELTVTQQLVADTLKRGKLVGSVSVKPQVPLFLTYFTIYPSPSGNLIEYPDVYGYDRVIAAKLRRYM